MGVLAGKASKGYKNNKSETGRSKIMDKYALLKRFHRDRLFQVYMYAFVYVNPDTIPMKEYFLQKTFVED